MRASKALNLAIAVVALALLVATGSSAATPRIEMAAAQGALTLSNSMEGEAIFRADAMRPGEEVTGTVRISNTGTVVGALSLATAGGVIEAPGIGGGLLSSRLELRVLDVTNAQRPVSVYAGLLAAMPSVAIGAIAPGEQREFAFVASMPSAGAADNAFQGAQLSAGFTWTAQGTPPAQPTPGAAPPAPAPAVPPPPAVGDQVFNMPASKRCVNRYKFRIRIRRPKGVRFKKVTVKVNRRAQVRLAGAKARKLKSVVKLRRLPKGRVVVKVIAVTERGAKLTAKRTYRTCSVKKAKKRKPRVRR